MLLGSGPSLFWLHLYLVNLVDEQVVKQGVFFFKNGLLVLVLVKYCL